MLENKIKIIIYFGLKMMFLDPKRGV
jgi:hypothetical protein